MNRRALLALLAAGCGQSAAPAKAPADPLTGADTALVAECLTCHQAIAAPWSALSTHRLVLDCASCHPQAAAKPGPQHRHSASCVECHSARGHQGIGCGTCHDVHGTPNLFLVRPLLNGHAVHLTSAEGNTADGLAHDGQGVCETCHTSTHYYRAGGGGLSHHDTWCGECHRHASGFIPQ